MNSKGRLMCFVQMDIVDDGNSVYNCTRKFMFPFVTQIYVLLFIVSIQMQTITVV